MLLTHRCMSRGSPGCLLKRDCYRVRPSWAKQLSFLVPALNWSCPGIFGKCFPDFFALKALSVILSVAFFDCWEKTHFICWMAGSPPFFSSPVRGSAICLPSSVDCSEHLPFLSAHLITQVTHQSYWSSREYTYNCIKDSLRRVSIGVDTTIGSTWKSAHAVTLLRCLFLPLSGLLIMSCVLLLLPIP